MKLWSTSSARSLAALTAVAAVALGSFVGSSPAMAAGTCRSYNYSYGGNGNCVSYIQTLANHKLPTIAGYRIAVDGQYGAATRTAIIRIQQRWGLAADGIVGPNTWAALCSAGTVSNYAGESFTAAEWNAYRAAGC